VDRGLPRAAIAVLPFANVTGDPAREYFGDALAEELIYLLSRVPGLQVSARTSSFSYKGKNLEVTKIARDLRVASVLEGSVRSEGDRVRVTAQLISGETGYHLWSQSFDRDFNEIFALQEEISTAIVRAIRDEVKIALQPVAMPPTPTRDMEAYRLYLQGTCLAARGAAQGVIEGIALLQMAIACDPAFARALGALATQRLALVFYGRPHEVGDAEREANQALLLDPTLAEARSALGMVHLVRREWLAAEAQFRAARALGVGNLPGFAPDLYLSAFVGHIRKSLQDLRARYERAPAEAPLLSLLAVANLALPLEARATDEAARYAELAMSLGMPRGAGPLPVARLYIAMRRGVRGDIVAAAQEVAAQLVPAGEIDSAAQLIPQICMGTGAVLSRASTLRTLNGLVENLNVRQVGPVLAVQVIAWYTMLGAIDQAYDFGERMLDWAIPSGSMGILLTWLWHPELRDFRTDRRFAPFVDRLGLLNYWKRFGPPDNCELKGGALIAH
jgi:TolB-like protein